MTDDPLYKGDDSGLRDIRILDEWVDSMTAEERDRLHKWCKACIVVNSTHPNAISRECLDKQEDVIRLMDILERREI